MNGNGTNGLSQGAWTWDALKKRTAAHGAHALDEAELAEIFAIRAEALARRDHGDTAQEGTTLLLGFSHGAMHFAVDPSAVSRVLAPRTLTRIPRAPTHLDRVLYEGGRVVSVLHPAMLFGDAKASAGEDDSVLLLEVDGVRLGVRATRVLGPRRFSLERLGSPSVALDPRVSACVRGIAEDLTIVFEGRALVEALRQT